MNRQYQFSLGDLAYTIRKLNGLTQVDYSSRLGVVQSTVSKVEKDVFDDVPFSLVCKISSEFNIPLNYFQAGLLPIRKTNGLYKNIPKSYIHEGVFKAKTIFYILKELKGTYTKKLYKDLKLPEQFLCLSNITYSFEFINKLHSLTGENLLKTIQALKGGEGEKIDIQNIYHHLLQTQGIDVISHEVDLGSIGKLKLSFNNDIQEQNEIYAELLKLELSILFNGAVSIEKSQDQKGMYLLSCPA